MKFHPSLVKSSFASPMGPMTLAATDAGRLVCDIGVAPISPTEFIMVSLVQDMNNPAQG